MTAQHINYDNDLTDVTVLRGGPGTGTVTSVIHTTAHHMFWNQTLGAWTYAAHLRPGHQLRTPDGAGVTVAEVRVLSGEQAMYDLTVDTIHTYYVLAGTTPVLVHNCGDLVGDAVTFRGRAHVLDEHVNVTQAEAIALAKKKLGPNGVFTDAQMAQVIVDTTQAFYYKQIETWLRGSDQQLVIRGNYGFKGASLGWVAMPNGTIRPAGNGFTVVLERQKGHAAGYYVQTAYPR